MNQTGMMGQEWWSNDDGSNESDWDDGDNDDGSMNKNWDDVQ